MSITVQFVIVTDADPLFRNGSGWGSCAMDTMPITGDMISLDEDDNYRQYRVVGRSFSCTNNPNFCDGAFLNPDDPNSQKMWILDKARDPFCNTVYLVQTHPDPTEEDS